MIYWIIFGWLIVGMVTLALDPDVGAQVLGIPLAFALIVGVVMLPLYALRSIYRFITAPPPDKEKRNGR